MDQALLGSAKQQDKRKGAKTDAQEAPKLGRILWNNFSTVLRTGTDRPERLWNLPH